MKKIILCLTGILLCSSLFSQDSLTKNFWTHNTAYTLPKGRFEFGLLSSSRYGINDKLEISAYPLTVIILPGIKLKTSWGDHAGIRLATEHGLLYPTQFMRLVSTEGTGGLISPEFSIPDMFAIDNRLLASFPLTKKSILSAHAGITFALNSGELDPASTIDLPIIYPRLAVFYSQPEFDLGLDYKGIFTSHFGWDFSVQNFIFAGTTENYFMENKGVLSYVTQKQGFRLEAGYMLCYGKYPFGTQWHLLPVLNLSFRIGK